MKQSDQAFDPELPMLNDLSNDIAMAMSYQGFWQDWDKVQLALAHIAQSQEPATAEMAEEEQMLLAFRRALLSEKLMLIVTEPAEGMEAHRKNRYCPSLGGDDSLLHLEDENNEFGKTPFEQHVKDTFEDELADTFIRLLDLVGKLDIDIEWHIKQKCLYNSTRARMHGDKQC